MSTAGLGDLELAVGATSAERDTVVFEVLRSLKRVAFVGASNNKFGAAARVMAFLMERDIEVVPVTSRELEVLGVPTVPTLEDVVGAVDLVDVFCRPEEALAIAKAAVTIGAPAIWFQDGIVNTDAAETARQGGLTVVMDRCLQRDYCSLILGEDRVGWFPV